MVGGRDYNTRPFNLATQGQRQPGSAIKPFILAEALTARHQPGVGVAVAQARLQRAGTASEKFIVNNFESTYAGTSTLAGALTCVRQLGLRRGRHRRSGRSGSPASRERMGIRTPVSLEPRDDARRPQAGRHAARHGARLRDLRRRRPARLAGRSARSKRRAGRHPDGSTLPRAGRTPVVLAKNEDPPAARARPRTSPQQTVGIMQTVVTRGHRQARRPRRRQVRGGQDRHDRELAATPGSSASPTSCTVAVWVGYPDKLKPMLTEFAGPPGRGRHVPGADLARLHDRREQDHRRPRRARSAPARACRPRTRPSGGRRRPPRRRRPRSHRPRRPRAGTSPLRRARRRRPRAAGRPRPRDAGARPDAHAGADPHPGAGAHADAGPRADADPHPHADAHAADGRHPARGGWRCRARLTPRYRGRRRPK